MSSTYTNTNSSTFTRTHAAYLASKVAADLRQMQRFYDKPTNQQIDDYITEIVELLVGGYLKQVEYGFKRGTAWVVALRYEVVAGSLTGTDDRPGRVPATADVAGASWYSYLSKSTKFYNLSERERQSIESRLPFSRSAADAPTASSGWSTDRSYSSTGTSINRSTYISS